MGRRANVNSNVCGVFVFFSSRRRHTRFDCDWSSDVCSSDLIRLINESAAQILGDEKAFPDALIGEACPRLLFLLESWRQGSAGTEALPAEDPTFVAADGARVIRAHFAPLGSTNPGPLLIFLEDTSLLGEKVQQSKLAALGRLSASIAHEIRNPVGAMSHAGQLLAESPHLAEEDRRLTQIIRTNADRVSGIIDNVQRLSRRERARLELLSLPPWTEEVHAEFCETMQWPRARLMVNGTPDPKSTRLNSSHSPNSYSVFCFEKKKNT